MGMHGFCWLFWSSIGWSSGFWVHNPLCGSEYDQFNWSGTVHPSFQTKVRTAVRIWVRSSFGHLGLKAIFILCFASIGSWVHYALRGSGLYPCHWSDPDQAHLRGHNQSPKSLLFGLRTIRSRSGSPKFTWLNFGQLKDKEHHEPLMQQGCTKPVILQLDFFK